MHPPFLHVPPMFGHVSLLLVQMLSTQQPPALQSPSSQHGSPGSPQTTHTPEPPPAHFPEEHTRPVQHSVPRLPQLFAGLFELPQLAKDATIAVAHSRISQRMYTPRYVESVHA